MERNVCLTKKKNVTPDNIDPVPPQNLPWKLGDDCRIA